MLVYLKAIKWTAIGLVLVAAFVLLPLTYRKWRAAEDRADQVAVYAVKKEAEYYKNSLGNEVAKTPTVVLDQKGIASIKEDLQYLREEFKGVKKNLRNVEVVSNTTASILDTLRLVNRDTTIIISGTPVVAKKFSYEDEYNSVTGIVRPDTTEVDLDIKVPLTTVVLWERKKFLGLKIGRKQYSNETTSKNKKVRIVDSEVILRKK